MERIIKFRIWDGGEMLTGDKVAFLAPRHKDAVTLNKALEDLQNGHALMQFTGLLDKNGVEIYEGDIVQYIDDEDEPINIEVFWKKEYGGFWPFYDCCPNWGLEDLEVIGNIYENPELTQ